MSPARRIAFRDVAELPEAPGIASHAVEVGDVRWALVRYEPGVLREAWCEEGHSGYVLEGGISYAFADGAPELRLEAGDGFTLPSGAPGHRGTAGPDGARLFLIDREG